MSSRCPDLASAIDSMHQVSSVLPDPTSCYRALSARDPRFDGVFFVGVTTTGVYCRPVCPARTPGADRCRYFLCAAAAETDGFRACFRCRPELAPGAAPIDASTRLTRLAVQRIESGVLDQMGVDGLADQLGVSARQLRRVLRDQIGASPIELANHRRLLLSRQLISSSSLSLAQIAFASGFRSIRRFNDAFSRRFGRAPSTLRRTRSTSDEGSFDIALPYRPPIAWERLLTFLGARAIPGVEHVSNDTYARTLRIDDHTGWVRVGAPAGSVLPVTISVSLAPVLLGVLGRLRNLFDTDAHPAQIGDLLAGDPRLSAVVAKHPGMRVPGTVDALELSCRSIVGQQISVRAATTLAGRLATLGEVIDGAPAPLNRLFPTARRLAEAAPSSLTDLGIIGARVRSIQAVASALNDRSLVLEPGSPPESTLERLQAIPGIGPWTARMIAMRALRWPDAFPVGDAVLHKITNARNDRDLESMSQRWSPWRAYAALYLWEMASEAAHQPKEKQP